MILALSADFEVFSSVFGSVARARSDQRGSVLREGWRHRLAWEGRYLLLSSLPVLRKRQIDALVRLLNLNEPVSKAMSKTASAVGRVLRPTSRQGTYKVLVRTLHQRCHHPAAQAERPAGVTLFDRLGEAERTGRARGLLPSRQRVKRRAVPGPRGGDHDVAHLNFCALLADAQLQELASGLTGHGLQQRVAALRPEPCLCFSGKGPVLPDAAARLCLAQRPEREGHGDREGGRTLWMAFFCASHLGNVPDQVQEGGAAEHVPGRSRPSARHWAGGMPQRLQWGSFHRPLLVLFDRNFDLTPQIQHC